MRVVIRVDVGGFAARALRPTGALRWNLRAAKGRLPHNSDGQSRPRSPLRDGAAWTSVGTQAARNNVPCRLYLENAGELYHPAIGMIGTYTWVLCDDAMETVASAKPSRLWHGEHPVPLPSHPY
jgi:hypothetical protein